MSSTLPPAAPLPGAPNPAPANGRDNVTVALALILAGVIALLLLVAINDDDGDSTETVSADSTATTESTTESTTGSGDSGESGGSLPAGEYQFTLTAPAGTVQYSGSCNVIEGVLTASGAGAQQETIVLSVDVVSQTGSASVAALGTEFEGSIDSATIGNDTFEVAGQGSEADDSAEGSVTFTVAGGCNTGGATASPTATPAPTEAPTPPPDLGTHDFTATIPEGTAALQGTCFVVGGALSVDGSGAAGETLVVNADANTQSGSMTIAAAGVIYEGTVTVVTIGEGTFEVSGTAVPGDDSATGEVPISASGGCDT